MEDSPCRASPGLGHQPSAQVLFCSLGAEEKAEVGEELLSLAKEREGAVNEESAGPPSLLPRGSQGAPGLFPAPSAEGCSWMRLKPALPHPS